MLKTKILNDATFAITGGTGGCHHFGAANKGKIGIMRSLCFFNEFSNNLYIVHLFFH